MTNPLGAQDVSRLLVLAHRDVPPQQRSAELQPYCHFFAGSERDALRSWTSVLCFVKPSMAEVAKTLPQVGNPRCFSEPGQAGTLQLCLLSWRSCASSPLHQFVRSLKRLLRRETGSLMDFERFHSQLSSLGTASWRSCCGEMVFRTSATPWHSIDHSRY